MNQPGKNTVPQSASSVIPPPVRQRSTGLHRHQLEHDVRAICRRNPQGPQATQIERQRTLLLCAAQLFQQGVQRKRAVNLSADDLGSLVDAWYVEQLAAATIRNRLVYLRWLARKIGKPQIVARSNRAYGAGREQT